MERIIKAERFIEEVRKRPAIWKINSRDYADRDTKQKCWQELAVIFSDIDVELLSDEDKLETVKLLRRKWKSFRDCFARENNRLRQEIIEGQVGARKTQYVYYKQLLFLNENDPDNAISIEGYLQDDTGPKRTKECFLGKTRKKSKPKNNKKSPKKESVHSIFEEVQYPYVNFVDSFEVSSNNVDFEEADITQPIVEINENPHPQNGFPKTNLRLEDDSGPIEILPIYNGKAVPPKNDLPPNDTDKLFLLSLLEPLKTIPESKRFGLKIKLMNLIQKAQAEEGIVNGFGGQDGDDMEDNSGYSSDNSLVMLEPEMEIVELQ